MQRNRFLIAPPGRFRVSTHAKRLKTSHFVDGLQQRQAARRRKTARSIEAASNYVIGDLTPGQSGVALMAGPQWRIGVARPCTWGKRTLERNITRGASFSVAVQRISAGGTRKKELSETGAWLDARHGILHWQCSQAWACDGAASRLIDTGATIRCTASAFADADAHAYKRRRAARAVLQDEVRKHWAAGNSPRGCKTCKSLVRRHSIVSIQKNVKKACEERAREHRNMASKVRLPSKPRLAHARGILTPDIINTSNYSTVTESTGKVQWTDY